MEAYTTTDIFKRLNIKRERIKNWISEGYITPSIQLGHGPGTKHLFSRFDLYIIKLFEHLLNRGFSRNVSKKWLRILWKTYSKGHKSKKKLPGSKTTLGEIIRNHTFLVIFGRSIPKNDEDDNEARGSIQAIFINGASELEGNLMNRYEDVFIVNFKQICDQVDTALK